MEKTAIKNFAIEARKILMRSAEVQAGLYGVTKDGCANPIQKGAGFEVYQTVAGTENRIYGEDISKRRDLVDAVNEIGFAQVMEKAAYTWFNRLIAIRFMEVNDYLPTRTRVLSSATGSKTPDIVTEYREVNLNLTDEDLEKVQMCIKENKYDDAFEYLFVKQCKELKRVLPKLFKKTDDYMELLLKLSYINDGVVRMLVDTIPECNFNVQDEGQVEIIGWMYQYYNTEPKSAAFGKKGKITKEEIPAVTQLFTPDWIVRYMVENSLGRLWVEGHPDTWELLKDNWKYYLEEAQQEPEVQLQLAEIRKEYAQLNPEDLTFMDCCMGSGHILVYAFDVLVQVYESMGYSRRMAVQEILKHNLYGLDIDDRAAQLSYFAVMMKALEYDKRFFNRDEQPQPQVYAIQESNTVKREQLKYFGAGLSEAEKATALEQMNGLLDTFTDGKEYGSILTVESYDWELLSRFAGNMETLGQMNFDTYGILETQKKMLNLIEIGKVMAQKYWVVSTNPPYAGTSNLSAKVNNFVKKNYPDSKADLFAVFIERCDQMICNKGYQAMITQHSWMFLASFEKLRKKIMLDEMINMIHLGAHAFEEIGGEIVQTTSFTRTKTKIAGYKGTYCRLVEATNQHGKETMFLSEYNRYIVDQNDFAMIPGVPIGYWLPKAAVSAFNKGKFEGVTKKGILTGNTSLFIRNWFEVNNQKIGFDATSYNDMLELKCKWYPLTSGGQFRRWYGNFFNVIDMENDAYNIKMSGGNIRLRDPEFYCKEAISWTQISFTKFSCRYVPCGILYGDGGPVSFFEKHLYYYLALLNSRVGQYFLNAISPCTNYGPDQIKIMPSILNDVDRIEKIAINNKNISKSDWDSFETSWNFMKHPLIRWNEEIKGVTETSDLYNDYCQIFDNYCSLEQSFLLWQRECQERFEQLKSNEEELNQIFIDIYGLQEELTPDVEDKDITVRKADLKRDIRSLISYAVGCMFGRYSLDVEGLAYAGGEWDSSKYKTFIPDDDNCIPITDEEYFDDDIVGRFCEFLKVVFGEESLEENLNYVANALGNKGNTSREIIRNYFLNDFFKDHCSTYSVTGSGKRPIYWLFDAGKQNGFKCLIYMHRYDKDTVNRVRSEYLKKMQDAIEGALKNAEYAVDNSSSAVDRATATRKRDKYIKQLNEIRAYYPALSHMALQRVEIDLDDGVKSNYAKFQGIETVDENGKKQKVDLLAKI